MKLCRRLILNSSFLILNFSKSAFSLIELSIVLIIIGLLIAGVTGGASLIQSAKVHSMINEIKDYERAVYTFQAARGRYPGDVKNYGTFGVYSNYYSSGCEPYYSYKATDFPSESLTEFQKTAGTNVIPDYLSAPFVELYNEGIIDFRPLGNAKTADKNNSRKGTPSSNVEPGSFIYYFYAAPVGTFLSKPCKSGVDGCYSLNGINLEKKKQMVVFEYSGYSTTKGFDPKFLKALDEKVDDGWYSTGVLRGRCFGKIVVNTGFSSYDDAIKNGKKCTAIYYAM